MQEKKRKTKDEDSAKNQRGAVLPFLTTFGYFSNAIGKVILSGCQQLNSNLSEGVFDRVNSSFDQ